MNWGTYAHSPLRGQAAGESEHFGSVGLHREVTQGPCVGQRADMQRPAERGVELTVEVRIVQGCVGPVPEGGVGPPVESQQLTSV